MWISHSRISSLALSYVCWILKLRHHHESWLDQDISGSGQIIFDQQKLWFVIVLSISASGPQLKQQQLLLTTSNETMTLSRAWLSIQGLFWNHWSSRLQLAKNYSTYVLQVVPLTSRGTAGSEDIPLTARTANLSSPVAPRVTGQFWNRLATIPA